MLAWLLSAALLFHIPPSADFMADWMARVQENGALTIELAEEYRDAHTPDPLVLPYSYSPPPSGVEQWRPLVEAHFRPGDVDRALRIMWCESHGDPNAKNPTSTASGLFQHLRGWWGGSWGPAFDPFDPAQSVAAAARMRYSRGSWSDWNASRGCWR